ncbi:hypothetical protein LINGRAHAP2_LOCUS34801 [Linum grandiflorum]
MDLTIADLRITDEVDLDSVDAAIAGPDYSLCLVGTLLTRHPYNFPALASRMANLWYPDRGVAIEQLENQLILCRFRHIVDLCRVLQEIPWHFDMSLLVLKDIQPGQSPHEVSLRTTDFWIQLSVVPPRFYSEAVGKSVGNTIGEFIAYDEENTYSAEHPVMRIRVRLDIMEPLKIERQLRKTGYATATCPLTYEKVPNFCYICGRLGHTDHLCEVIFQVPEGEIFRVWNESPQAPARCRRRSIPTSPYLLQSVTLAHQPQHSSPALAKNIQELQAILGASPLTAGTQVAFGQEARNNASASVIIPESSKRRRAEENRSTDTMEMDKDGMIVSPTKKQHFGNQMIALGNEQAGRHKPVYL